MRWTALHISAYRGFADIVELLLDHGANARAEDKRGYSALTLCYQQWEFLQDTDGARNNQLENCLVALIEADRHAAVEERHLLSAAARKGSMPVLEALAVS